MLGYQACVREFHEKHGITSRRFYEGVLTQEDIQLRRRLIMEEWAEVIVACHEGQNHVLIADGLCDLLYVLYGTAVTYGFNLEREMGLGPEVSYKGTKLPLEIIGDFEQEITRAIGGLFLRMYYRANVQIGLMEVIQKVHDYGFVFQFPMDTLYTEVQRSNMTKAALDENKKGGKVGKGVDFQPPRIEEILAKAFRGEILR